MKRVFFALFCAALLAGCADETDNHPLLRKAAQSKRMGEYRNAEVCYKRYLAKNPDAAQIHLNLAQLYDEHLEDYLLAVYHYKEYLRLCDDKESRTAKSVKTFITRSEKRYVSKTKSVKKVFLTDEAEIERLTAAYKKRLADEEQRLAKELAELKKEAETVKTPAAPGNADADSAVAADKKEVPETAENISAVQKADSAVDNGVQSPVQTSDNSRVISEKDIKTSNKISADSPVAADKKAENAVTAEEPEKRQAETIKDFSKLPVMEKTQKTEPAKEQKKEEKQEIKDYTVQRGDTFSHLSRKFYGSTRYYRKLMEYNKISNPNGLRSGKTIKIPPLEILKGAK